MGLFSRSSPEVAVAEPAASAAAPQAGAFAAARSSPMQSPTPIVRGEREIYFEKMKVRIHQQLVERLDVQNLKLLPPETVRQEVRALIRELCQTEKGLLNSADQERLMDEVMDETFGLGPLEVLLKDPTITDVL